MARRPYFRSMKGSRYSHRSALLLVLMVFWCAPVKWLHSCGDGGPHVHTEGRTVSIKEHCPLCDLAIPLATANERVEVKEPSGDLIALGSPSLSLGAVSGLPVRQGRAPPVVERA